MFSRIEAEMAVLEELTLWHLLAFVFLRIVQLRTMKICTVSCLNFTNKETVWLRSRKAKRPARGDHRSTWDRTRSLQLPRFAAGFSAGDWGK